MTYNVSYNMLDDVVHIVVMVALVFIGAFFFITLLDILEFPKGKRKK